MLSSFLWLTVVFSSPIAAGHEANSLFQQAMSEGLKVDGEAVKLPPPTFRDAMTADEQAATIRQIAGSDRAVAEMKSPSISAPHKMFLKDTKQGSYVIRGGDLYFTLPIALETIKPDEALRTFQARTVEAGNIKVESKILKPNELGPNAAPPAENQWYARSAVRLLDRITVNTTDQLVLIQTAESLVFCSRTDPKFVLGSAEPNEWRTLTIKGATESLGPPQPYIGGIGYLKMTRFKDNSNSVFVELHFLYAEPIAWFDGAPILRSKFGLIAQDQIRRLRAELKKSNKSKQPQP